MQTKNSRRKRLELMREKRNTSKLVQAVNSRRDPLKLMKKKKHSIRYLCANNSLKLVPVNHYLLCVSIIALMSVPLCND